ncbi:MAG: aromatic aminobenezylarsenical efflux permease ArsG family transporter [Acidobacteriota bacterium]
MDTLVAAGATALWLGLLTSLSPCPLATNIAAVSWLGRDLGDRRRVLASGIAYTAGRTLTYTVLAAVLVGGALSVPQVSMALQRNMNRALGPLLILTAIVLLGLVRVPGVGTGRLAQRVGERARTWGLAGSLVMGLTFALTFCPVSAALYFGTLLPLSIDRGSPVALPALYGVGTAAPVVAFALAIALGAQVLGRAFRVAAAVELWSRRGTALVFLVVGFYMTWVYTLGW